MHRIIPLVLAAAFGACRGTGAAGSTDIRVEVTEGTRTGRYRAASRDPACWRDLAGAGSLAVRFTDLTDGAALSSLQLVIAPEGGFYLGLVLDGFRPGGREHEVDTRAGRSRRGSGAAALRFHEAATVVEIRARTDAGVTLIARVLCTAVFPAAAGARPRRPSPGFPFHREDQT